MSQYTRYATKMTQSTPIRVVLADDHALVRDSIARWLDSESGIETVARARNADEAVAACSKHKPDIVLLDIDMPGRLSFDAARTMRAVDSDLVVVFLSAFTHDKFIESALDCGASGYLTKREVPERLVAAIHEVAAGGMVFSPEVQSRLVFSSDGIHLSEVPTRLSMLSNREFEVLRYIAQGLSKRAVASVMHLSVKTVDNHTRSLMAKLDLHDRVHVARFAIREGIVEP